MNFNDIEDANLRPYNRLVMFYNIMEDGGKVPAQEYASQFSMEERTEMLRIADWIKRDGLESVKAYISRNLILPKEEEEIVNG